MIVYTRDQNDLAKQQRAIEWLTETASRQAIVISPQVLNETMRVFVEKFDIDIADLLAYVHRIASWCTAPLDPVTTEQALRIRERWKFDWWDCLIVASASAAGCDCLLTEDLQNGQNLDGLTVINPFVVEPSSIFRT